MRAVAFFLAALPLFSGIRVGAAHRTITPALNPSKPVYLAGFGQNRVATGIHDELSARCVALQSGNTVVLCGVDLIGLHWDDVLRIRSAVKRQYGKPMDVVIAATHTHQGPDTMGLWGPRPDTSGLDETYNAYVVSRTAEAAIAALRSMKRARVYFTRTHTSDLDAMIRDNRPPVLHDSELVVMHAAGRGGKGIATLINWANHPEALGSKNTEITADFVAAIYRDTETRLGGVTVFVNGAPGGMQTPLGAKIRDPRTNQLAEEATFRKAEVIGNKIADIAVATLDRREAAKIGGLEYRERLVEIPVTKPVGLLELRSGRTLVFQAAMLPDAPLEAPVRPRMTARFKMLIGWYGEVNSVGPEAARLIAETFASLLKN